MALTVAECIVPAPQFGAHSPQQDPLPLHDFRDLIANMPVSQQAFTSKQSTWTSHLAGDGTASAALGTIFGESTQVSLSRGDLRCLAKNEDLAEFLMATIIWGYPRGMRGNNVVSLIRHFDMLMELVSAARHDNALDWKSHHAKVAPIAGIGLSTYTKFLAFLSVPVHGHTALILDDRIIRVAQQGIFQELAPLQSLSNSNKARSYPRYLECMHSLAGDLTVSAEQLEFFLFEFGLNLKPRGRATIR